MYLFLVAALSLPATFGLFAGSSTLENEICRNTSIGDSMAEREAYNLYMCFDIDRNGVLDLNELTQMVKSNVCNRGCTASRLPPTPPAASSCPATVDPNTGFRRQSSAGNSSLIITPTDVAKLQAFFNGSFYNLTLLYSSNGSLCDANTYLAATDPNPNILVVARSAQGYLFGAYRSL